MTSGAPWSVKGIDPKAREVAKDLARRSGMTLGEWLNRIILEDDGSIAADDGPEEITSQSYFEQRPSSYYETPRTRDATYPSATVAAPEPVVGRYEAPQHPGDEIGRVAQALDRLTQRIEQSETRTGLAITGVEHSVREAVARIEASEREHIAVSARFEGGFEDAHAEQAKLAERLRKIEKEAPGPRSTEALHALETSLGKVAAHLYEGETRARESFQALEERIDQIAAREPVAAVAAPVDTNAIIEEVVAQVGARLSHAESLTGEALRGLGDAFAALDHRLRSVESGPSPAVEQRLEALAAQLSARVEASRAEIAQKLQASADTRFDRMERTLGEMAEHVRHAEQTSAQAIERMGQEVLNIADTLNRRVQTAEQRSADAIEQVGGEVARVAHAVETRLGRADTVHANALERLGAEIGRITERLAERMGAAERRSAQAIDDVGEQVARVTERIQQRQERVSEELSDRIRQSEERTARLLEEARDTIDRGLADSQRRFAEQVAAAPPRLVRDEPAAGFAEDPFPAFGPAEPEPEPLTRQAFASEPEPAPSPFDDVPAEPFAAESASQAFDVEDFEAADDFVRIDDAVVTEQAAPEAQAWSAAEPEEPEAHEPDPFAPQALAAEFGAPAADRIEADEVEEDDVAEFEPFEPEAEPETDEYDPRHARDAAQEAAAFDPDATLDEEPPEPQRPLSTREVIEQARAAARAANQPGEAKKARARPERPVKAEKPAKVEKPVSEKTSGFSLFSGFGSRPKRRAGSTLQTALLITGGAAFLSLSAAGIMIADGQPKGELPKRVADSLTASSGEIKAAEADTTPFGENPRVSVALAPQPLTAPAAASADTAELAALYAQATRDIETQQAGGLAKLQQAANLGHSPSQFYLSKLYENGTGGVAKDLVEARRWTERAAENGNRHAMHNLAIAYVDGKGGPKNSTTAAQWFRRAADLGLVDSQYNLGALNEQGLGVTQNGAEAYKWYLIAARTGDEEARKSAARVRAQLSPEARTVAERAAVAFRPATPNAAVTAVATASGPVSDTVLTAQRALSRLGYYRGPADGASSPALQGAMAQYQRDQGLAATGALDQTTMARLAVFTR